MTELRILTVKQPWAYAIMYGGKDVENRTRNIAGSYRGPVAIQASATYSREADEHPEVQKLARRCGVESMSDYLIGYGQQAYRHIIGVVDLVDVHHSHEITTDEPIEYVCGSFAGMDQHRTYCSKWAEDGAHHLVIANPRPLAEPIPFKGALGLRRLDPIFARAVLNEAAWSLNGGAS